jgi:hypothetical protein
MAVEEIGELVLEHIIIKAAAADNNGNQGGKLELWCGYQRIGGCRFNYHWYG